jgi:hypothetical protein
MEAARTGKARMIRAGYMSGEVRDKESTRYSKQDTITKQGIEMTGKGNRHWDNDWVWRRVLRS